MKRFILIVFILIPVFSFCQEQFPVFSEKNTWQILEEGFDWYEYSQTIIHGDTVINDKPYKIIRDPELGFPISGSDILGFGYDENGKTFFRPVEDWDYSYDMILYDFNLTVGDTFHLPPFYPKEDYPNHIAIVLEIDSVELSDGSFRKRYNFGNQNNLPNTGFFNCLLEDWFWIDGIGDPIHPVYAIMDCFESVVNLDCYKYQGQELYGNCFYSPIFETQLNSIEIFPNPVSDKFIIKDPNNEVQLVELFDINGYRVLSREKTEQINLNEFPDGIYVLKIQVKNGSMVSKKIMKFE